MDQDQNGKVGFRKQAIRFEIFASNLNFIDIVQSYGLMVVSNKVSEDSTSRNNIQFFSGDRG